MKSARAMLRTLAMAFALMAPAGMRAQERVSLTLDEAIEIALSESPVIRMADKEIEKTGYAKKGTYAALYPQIDASASYQRTIKKQVMYMGGFDGGIEIGTDNNWNGGFGASMPIVNVGLWKSLKISAMDVEMAVEKARGSRIDMIEQVSNAFYAVLLAEDNHKVYKEIYDNARSNYDNVKQKFDVGRVSEYDLISAGVTVSNAEPAMYDAENNVRIALWQLKALMGIDLDTEIECADSLGNYRKTMTGAAVDLSVDGNSALAQLEIQRRQLDKSLEATKAADYPTLGLTANYQWSSMDNTFRFRKYRWIPYSVAAISLNIPIFAGGKRRSDIRQVEKNIESLALRRENTERELQVEMLQQTSRMQTCIRQFDAASSSVEEAQRGYDIAVRRYEVGGGTLLEIDNSQVALARAQLNLNRSIYDYLVAQNATRRLRGKYDEKER